MRVFAQTDRAKVDLAALIRNARAHFSIDVEVQSERTLSDEDKTIVVLAIRSTKPKRPFRGQFEVTARPRTDADLEQAREAEVRGKAGGMSLLAERCRTVWVLRPREGADEAALLALAALSASVALGPVLPDDGSTLFGVRGANERLERLFVASG